MQMHLLLHQLQCGKIFLMFSDAKKEELHAWVERRTFSQHELRTAETSDGWHEWRARKDKEKIRDTQAV